jgi:hypothetical protein
MNDMKSKYIFTVVVGFVIFVHAHYISSWINYYEAPMLNRTKYNEHLDSGYRAGYGETFPEYGKESIGDSLAVAFTDSVSARTGHVWSKEAENKK